MGVFAEGDVVVAPLDFSDFSDNKRRPALVVATSGPGAGAAVAIGAGLLLEAAVWMIGRQPVAGLVYAAWLLAPPRRLAGVERASARASALARSSSAPTSASTSVTVSASALPSGRAAGVSRTGPYIWVSLLFPMTALRQ